jgi:cytochrome c553
MIRFKIPVILLFSAATVLAVALTAVSPTRAGDDEQGDESRIRQGLNALPFDLNLRGKNIAAVGLGSYLVNVAGDCNGCHVSDIQKEYLPGGDPFMGQPAKIDPNTYLVGGRVFIPAHPGFHAIVSRNLRPEANGLPEGHTYEDFLKIIRTGVDLDQAHLEYGPLLQVMPWPNFRNMTDHDIRAIYAYLSALPPNPNPQP